MQPPAVVRMVRLLDVAELRSLSRRQLRDLGIDHSAIDTAARRAVYGR